MQLLTLLMSISAISMIVTYSQGFLNLYPFQYMCQCRLFRTTGLRLPISEDDSETDASSQEERKPMNDSSKCASDKSDMSDRFKYKVNALLGVYDPQAEIDNERQTGNILNAMLTFPTWYSFVVVGKTKGQDAAAYLEQVQSAVASVLGKDHRREWRTIPRGKNFTKITMTALVESAAEVKSIYQVLEALEMTIMRY